MARHEQVGIKFQITESPVIHGLLLVPISNQLKSGGPLRGRLINFGRLPKFISL